MKRLILIDSHAVIHRAFHALPPLTSPDGRPVNAVYGFASLFLKVLRELKPDYVVAAFDHAGPTFRHAAFERYKATRVKAPDALYAQIPLVKEIVAAFGIPVIEKQGYEADDLIGTIATEVRRAHPLVEIVIVSGDLDTLQLVDAKTKVFTMRKGISDTVLYDEAAVRARYGLSPRQLIDFKGLRGDPSDNIPGVKGIGEKTATELLGRYGTVEQIYRLLKKDRVEAAPGVITALKAQEADALFSKTLGTIDCHVPMPFVLESSRIRKSATEESSRAVLERFGFRSLLGRLGSPPPPVPHTATDVGTPPFRIDPVKSLSRASCRGGAVIVRDPGQPTVFIAVARDHVYQLPAKALRGTTASRWFLDHDPIYAFDAKPLLAFGLPYDSGRIRDAALMWYLLDPGRKNYSPEALVTREAKGTPPRSAAESAAALFDIVPRLEARIEAEGLTRVYRDFEAPLVPILAAMERLGIGFEGARLLTLSKTMARDISVLEKRIYRAAGSPFNINSPRQVAAVLFETMGLAPSGIRRTAKSGAFSTSEIELVKLVPLHPIAADILRYRELAKLKSTYVDALPAFIGSDHRIHTSWNQMGTATGRLASSNPNLQNIPIRSRFGREIRKAFVAARGFTLVAFDYSQLELRIAADLSGDEKMIDAFRRGVDIHRLTAAEVNNIPMEQVTDDLRSRAKTLNFGVLYGMGSRAFAETARVGREEAQHFIEEYFQDFSGVARFIEATKAMARERGFVQTAFGRKRFFPEINQTNFRLQREAERMAVNHPIQGSAADIVKKAMIAVDRYLRTMHLGTDVRLILQVHDELVFEMKRTLATTVAAEIQRIMEGVWQGQVAMRVAVKRGVNWGDLEA